MHDSLFTSTQNINFFSAFVGLFVGNFIDDSFPPIEVIYFPFNGLLPKYFHKHACLTAFLQIGSTVSKMKPHFAYLRNLSSLCILLKNPFFQIRFIMKDCGLYT